MTRLSLLLVISCQIATLTPILGVRGDDENPYMQLASSFLQNMADSGNENGLGALGSIIGTFMQGDAAKNLGAMLGQNGNGGNNAADMLSGLGSLLGGQQDGKVDPAFVLSMISMIGQQLGKSEQPKKQKRQIQESDGSNKVDPEFLLSMISTFAQQLGKSEQPKKQARQIQESNDLNLEGILSMASGLLGNQNVASILPVILNSLNSFSEPETKKRAEEHKDHASFLPPYLEKVHLYWDLFINSELGKTMWEKSGLRKVMKAFTGPDGKISFEMMFKNFENRSFRRHWIKTAAKYLTDAFMQIAKPEVYQRYLSTTQYILNGFMDTQGLPKEIHFDMKKPDKSFVKLINYALKKYMDIHTDVSGYIKPAMDYLKQTIKMAEAATQNLAKGGDTNLIVDRLTDTLNLEVIEPVLRVYRAYRHSVEAPHCQEHLMCLVNRHDSQKDAPGFKAGLTKVSSLIASAAISYQNGKGFWDLYSAIQNDVNCEAAYPADCSAFHEHELKVTTEVYHSEL
ncbi:unnamed protein product [Chilo suppressalis]|uniref:Seminal fluid protein n=1 Tax=Chilo suppressalis TaxID=168631 RepID=A0ABN8AYS5_CHISP|nr:unnamed protein product [Chilo suppressalis]